MVPLARIGLIFMMILKSFHINLICGKTKISFHYLKFYFLFSDYISNKVFVNYLRM